MRELSAPAMKFLSSLSVLFLTAALVGCSATQQVAPPAPPAPVVTVSDTPVAPRSDETHEAAPPSLTTAPREWLALDETEETVFVLLREVVSPYGGSIGPLSQATLTIIDDDPPPSLSVSDLVVTEGDTGTQVATFFVTLSAPSERQVRFSARTTDGTALAGERITSPHLC